MNFTKKNALVSLFILMCALIYQLIKYGSLNWIETSNILFMIAGVLLIIGLSGLVLASGSFDFFHYSIRKSLRREPKENGFKEPLNPHALSSSVGKSYQNVLTIGLLLLGISIVCLWDYIL
nr:DUF3899 domain-containing protein [uncultured Trichococcus sp.]